MDEVEARLTALETKVNAIYDAIMKIAPSDPDALKKLLETLARQP